MSDKRDKLEGNLRISLFAGSVLVAESENPILWQRILAIITKSALSENKDSLKEDLKEYLDEADSGESDSFEESSKPPASNNAVEKMAQQLGISKEQFIAACAPTSQAPYITLDSHYWASFRERYSARGASSVSNIAVVATLLCLWFKSAGIQEQPTTGDCTTVLKEINLEDKNPVRSLQNCTWLQKRGRGISIDPTEINNAIAVAKSYCVKNQTTKAA